MNVFISLCVKPMNSHSMGMWDVRHKLLLFVKDISVETLEKTTVISFAKVRWVHVHNSQNLVTATSFEHFLYVLTSAIHLTITCNLIFTASLFCRRGNYLKKLNNLNEVSQLFCVVTGVKSMSVKLGSALNCYSTQPTKKLFRITAFKMRNLWTIEKSRLHQE